MSYKAAVIGLGNMGMGYDFDLGPGFILTHASAFQQNPSTTLSAGVDPDAAARSKFEKKFSAPAYATVEELLSREKIDIFSIAVPSQLHFELTKSLLSAGAKTILAEKPVANNLADALEIQRLASTSGCNFLVNFPRRFDPAVIELKNRIAEGEIGQAYKGTLWYSKGILHNGSHFIDLLSFLFGPCHEARVLVPSDQKPDPEPDLQLRFGDLTIFMLAGREKCFSIGALEVIGTEGSFRYAIGEPGITFKKVSPDPLFPGYHLLADASPIPVKTDRYMEPVVNALLQAMQGQPAASNIHTAIDTMKVIHQITEENWSLL